MARRHGRGGHRYTPAGPVTVTVVDAGAVVAVWEDALPPYSSGQLAQVLRAARGHGRAAGPWQNGKARG